MRDILQEIIGIIVIVILFFAFLFFVHTLSLNHENEIWNGGHCDCGGTWKYEQAVGHRSSTSYIYMCEECGKRIEIHEADKQVQNRK